VKISELQRLAQQADESAGTLVDPADMTVASDAMQAFKGFDARLVSSVAHTLTGIESMRLANATAITSAAAKMQSITPIIPAPQISDALAGMSRQHARTFAEAVAPLRTAQQFDFLKTLPQMTIGPSVIDAVRVFNLPPALSAALDDVPPVSLASVARETEDAAADAVALAEDLAQIIDEALERMDTDEAASRRIVATEVAAAISAFLILAGILYHVGQFKAAGVAIGCVATLVRVYWRLTGKLD